MAQSEQEIARLILKFIGKNISPEEVRLLHQYLDENPANPHRLEELTKIPGLKIRLLEFYNSIDTGKEDAAWLRIRNRLREQVMPEQPAPQVRHYSFKWIRYAAAAIVIVTAGVLGYQLTSKKSNTDTIKSLASPSLSNDVLPGSDKAVLTLADGSTILLDNAHNGELAREGSTKINKLADGQLAYRAGQRTNNTAVIYNTLTTPRSGQFKIILPDGTQVWLNNASSLHYPAVFSGDERRVELSGEAYFEVAKDKAHPFKVSIQPAASGIGGGTVEVLGTHFNIMAYPDENLQKTTLLEGAIKFSKDSKTTLLKPAQQVNCNKQGQLKLLSDIDTDETIAWKNGYFNFLNADVPAVMRQLARWYDVEVSYESGIPEKDFNGKIPRSTHLADVVDVLRLSQINCRIEGKKLIVKGYLNNK